MLNIGFQSINIEIADAIAEATLGIRGIEF